MLKKYSGHIFQIGSGWRVDDAGNPPQRGELVEVNGRKARVVVSSRGMDRRNSSKFEVRFVNE